MITTTHKVGVKIPALCVGQLTGGGGKCDLLRVTWTAGCELRSALPQSSFLSELNSVNTTHTQELMVFSTTSPSSG